jgi:hypothetical protein
MLHPVAKAVGKYVLKKWTGILIDTAQKEA